MSRERRSRVVRGWALTCVAISMMVPPAGGVTASLPAEDPTAATRIVSGSGIGAVRLERGWAVPLGAPRPPWFTPELSRRVRQARGAPVAAPAAATPPEDGGIRPGTLMVSPNGCTMNFVFRRRGSFAIGTAGHCVDRLGQHVQLLVGTRNGSSVIDVGKVVMRAYNTRGLAPDFALVRIRDRLEHLVGGRIMEIGGPCGIYRGGGIVTLRHYGYPLGFGVGVDRVGVSRAWRGAAYTWIGAVIPGDSGSPVRTAGLAAAGNVGGIVVAGPGWIPGEMYGTRMTWIEDFVAPWRLLLAADC